jgi:hypothetical protein
MDRRGGEDKEGYWEMVCIDRVETRQGRTGLIYTSS